MTFIWTDEAVEVLRRRAAEGASPGQVAGVLGTSRSAVLGKARRVGVRFARGVPRPGATAAAALLDDVLAMRPPEGTVLWEIRRPQCRWLLREGAPWVFCGAPAVEKRSYCEEHVRRVYVPPRPKERKNDAAQ